MGCAVSPSSSAVEEVVHVSRVMPPPRSSSKKELRLADRSIRRPPKRFTIRLVKRAGELVGASLGNAPTGAVVFNILEGGLIDRWNMDNPDLRLCPGFILEEVNGVSGYWNLLEVLRKEGPLVCRVSTEPPASAGPNWFEEVATMARDIQKSANKGPFMLRLPPQDPSCQDRKAFSILPGVQAGDCGVDQCTICLEDAAPNEMLVQLPCGHAYHALCVARWLTQSSLRPSAKRQSCPLCSRRMVGTPEGGVCCVEGDVCAGAAAAPALGGGWPH